MAADAIINSRIDVSSTSFVDHKIPVAVTLLISVCIALNSFPHTTTIREIAYYLSLILSIAYCIKKREWTFLKTPFTLPVGLFVFWAFIGLFSAIDIERSLHDFRSHLLEYIALFSMLVLFFRTQKNMTMLGWIVVLAVTVSSALGLYKFYYAGGHALTSRFILSDPQEPVGPVGFMAAYAVLLAMHLFRLEKHIWTRILLSCCLLILAATVYFVQTRAILLALPLAFIVFFWKYKKMLALFLLITFFAGFITVTKFRPWEGFDQYYTRIAINYISYMIVKENPITGIGFGIATFGDNKFIDHDHYWNQLPEKFKYVKYDITSPHNMWAGIAVRTGIVGLLIFLAIIVVCGRMCRIIIRHGPDEQTKAWGYFGGASLVLFCIYGLFNAVFLHFLELLLCLSFSLVAINYINTRTSFTKIGRL